MNLRHRRYPTVVLIAALIATTLSCGDNSKTPTSLRLTPGQPNAEILDGAHGNGNKDVFFLLPMAFPNNSPGFGTRPFQPNLPVAFKIRNLATGAAITQGLTSVQMSAQLEDYHALWNTKSPVDVPPGTYRVETWVGSHLVAFADVVLYTNLKQFFSIDTKQFVPLPDDWTLLIRVRVQAGWNCENKASCVSQSVSNDLATPVIVTTNDGLNAAKFSGHWHDGNFPVLVSIEDISATVNKEGQGGCSLGIRGVVIASSHCVRITTDPKVVVTNPVSINTCMQTPLDRRQLVLKYDVGETPTFLREAPPAIVCPEGYASTSHSPNAFVRFASNTLSRIARVLTPKSAYAIDLGVGGFVDNGGGFSVFTLGMPANMNILAGDGQTGTAGNAVEIAPQVRLVSVHSHTPATEGNPYPEGLTGASVTCTVQSEGASVGGAPSALAMESSGGVYTCPSWVLGSGANSLRVSAAGYNASVAIESLSDSDEPSSINSFVNFTATGTAVFGFQSVALDATTFVIGGDAVNYTAIIQNPGDAIANVVLQGWILQNDSRRGANGTFLGCGQSSGSLPTGKCTQPWSAAASNSAGGSGTLVPGDATLLLELRVGNVTDGRLLASRSIPITLMPAP